MIICSKNPYFNLNSIIPYALIAVMALIIFSTAKHQARHDKPCCIKGYICKAVMSMAK